jgi:hypothetical protein
MAIGYTLGGWFVHSARGRITAKASRRVTISMPGAAATPDAGGNTMVSAIPSADTPA